LGGSFGGVLTHLFAAAALAGLSAFLTRVDQVAAQKISS
jgi:hypothetical protein